MNFEPQKFYIGLIDFFSILLPGALLTYLLKNSIGPLVLGEAYSTLQGMEGLIVFLFSSYLLGHFIFLIGSSLIDDHIYDRIRQATYARQIKKLAQGKVLSSSLTRWLAKHFFKEYSDLALNKILKIKKFYLNSLNANPTINAFQWAKARLNMEHANALATIERFEADSKFFRSFLVVLCILVPWNLGIGNWEIALVCIPLLILALWRYINQRMKATRQAYWYIITLEASEENGYRQQNEISKDKETHAGGVVFRKVKIKGNDVIEFLLVQAKNNPNEWVLPKGHIKSDESQGETAVREVREETGVWAGIKESLNDISFISGDQTIKLKVYLMEAIEIGKSEEERETIWLSLDAALDKATHKEIKEETKDMLIHANNLINNKY